MSEVVIIVEKDMSFGNKSQYSYKYQEKGEFWTDGVFQDTQDATTLELLHRVLFDVERKVNNAQPAGS